MSVTPLHCFLWWLRQSPSILASAHLLSFGRQPFLQERWAHLLSLRTSDTSVLSLSRWPVRLLDALRSSAGCVSRDFLAFRPSTGVRRVACQRLLPPRGCLSAGLHCAGHLRWAQALYLPLMISGSYMKIVTQTKVMASLPCFLLGLSQCKVLLLRRPSLWTGLCACCEGRPQFYSLLLVDGGTALPSVCTACGSQGPVEVPGSLRAARHV